MIWDFWKVQPITHFNLNLLEETGTGSALSLYQYNCNFEAQLKIDLIAFFVLINILVGICLSGSQVDEKFLVRREKFYEDFETEVLPPP